MGSIKTTEDLVKVAIQSNTYSISSEKNLTNEIIKELHRQGICNSDIVNDRKNLALSFIKGYLFAVN